MLLSMNSKHKLHLFREFTIHRKHSKFAQFFQNIFNPPLEINFLLRYITKICKNYYFFKDKQIFNVHFQCACKFLRNPIEPTSVSLDIYNYKKIIEYTNCSLTWSESSLKMNILKIRLLKHSRKNVKVHFSKERSSETMVAGKNADFDP